MKVAVVGSRQADGQAIRQILRYLPANASEIVSGGAQGIDTLASQIAALLGRPEGTLRSRLSRCIKKLRNTLSDDEQSGRKEDTACENTL